MRKIEKKLYLKKLYEPKTKKTKNIFLNMEMSELKKPINSQTCC